MKAAAIFGLALLAGLAFVAFPTPVLGTSGDTLSRSINGQVAAFGGECSEQGEEWQCGVWDSQVSGTKPHEVTVDRWGCWTATPMQKGKPFSGCINLLDHFDVF